MKAGGISGLRLGGQSDPLGELGLQSPHLGEKEEILPVSSRGPRHGLSLSSPVPIQPVLSSLRALPSGKRWVFPYSVTHQPGHEVRKCSPPCLRKGR